MIKGEEGEGTTPAGWIVRAGKEGRKEEKRTEKREKGE